MVAFAGISPTGTANAEVFHRTLTFEQRVDYQRKIEEVYWRHRIWPTERTDSKPALEAVMSRDQIENKVRDHLRNSRVLEDYWQRPISFQQVQAEMERMVQQTKSPEMLRELFEALGNDPFVIAECLARPALSERLVNEFYEINPTPANVSKQRAANPTEAVFTNYSLPLLTGNPSVCTDPTWSSLIDQPARRAQHTAVWTGSEMIVWGGRNYGFGVGTGDRYNPATDQWSKVSLTHAPVARTAHTAVWTGTEMIVWGGTTLPENAVLKSGGRYDPASDSWKPTNLSNAPANRFFHTAVWTGSLMVVWGGIDATQTDPGADYSNTGGLYDPGTNTWTAISNANAPVGRFAHSAVWTGSEMLVWGGQSYSGGSDIGGRYNPAANKWTTISAVNAPLGRSYHSAVWTGDEMIIWGGDRGETLNDGARYNPATDAWVALSAINPPAGRFFHHAVWTGSEMIVWGGNAYPDGQVNSGSRYNPTANTWTPMSVKNAPSARDTNTTVWTGSEMIVFGGGYDETLNTGGRYDPTADTWTPVRTTNTPDGRYQHTAVWTGSEMIVWGGRLNSLFFADSGGRYDPALDTWTPTSTANAPVGREAHTVVWTGTEMIVWGGHGPPDGRFLNTGGRYSPATDNWIPTTLTNAPTARRGHSSVWTGSEMIVWGGESGGASVNTGGRYKPDTDSWIATKRTNAPDPRLDHTAVWTGSEMIVWGGGHYAISNTGGRYNPKTDSWIATSTISTPPRSAHRAIWTGKEMIVWGGSNGSVHVNTGARYNPSTDTWAATSVFNAPDGRALHAAIWTGAEMIVWGGYSYEQDRSLNTGGRYNPAFDSWTALTTVNAPKAASSSTAVWTGSRMIVWGGLFSFTDSSGHFHNYVLSTGAGYCVGEPGPPLGRLANISTRAFVQTGDNVMIGGLIVTGSGPKKLILRAIGPSLSDFGIADALQDPVLELHDSTGALIASNNNWMDASNRQAMLDSGLAPSHNLESAILTTLNPGAYTAVIRGVNNGTGTAVVEAYDLDLTASSKFGNISTRAFAQTGNDVMIGGLIITGSGSEIVVVRAIGPSLTQLGVANALADPMLELRDRNGALIASNDNWIAAPNKQAIIDSSLAPGKNLESAILTSLNPGSYTAIVRGANNGVGVAVVEVFGLN
jgi:N-acetylneuraminic acid mutarotase